MNKSAYKNLLEDAKNKLDQNINTSITSISESMMIAENVDSVIAIHKENIPNTEDFYLTFKDIKSRSRKTHISKDESYFAHPFVDGNSMRLQEDVELDKSLSVNKLTETLDIEEVPNTPSGRSNRSTTKVKIEEVLD